MDWRRICTTGVMQVARAGEVPYFMPIIWYWAPDGAKEYDGVTAFSSGEWDDQHPLQPPVVGEQPPYGRPFSQGKNLWGYTGQCFCGTREAFEIGLTAAELAATPALPACCSTEIPGLFGPLPAGELDGAGEAAPDRPLRAGERDGSATMPLVPMVAGELDGVPQIAGTNSPTIAGELDGAHVQQPPVVLAAGELDGSADQVVNPILGGELDGSQSFPKVDATIVAGELDGGRVAQPATVTLGGEIDGSADPSPDLSPDAGELDGAHVQQPPVSLTAGERDGSAAQVVNPILGGEADGSASFPKVDAEIVAGELDGASAGQPEVTLTAGELDSALIRQHFPWRTPLGTASSAGVAVSTLSLPSVSVPDNTMLIVQVLTIDNSGPPACAFGGTGMTLFSSTFNNGPPIMWLTSFNLVFVTGSTDTITVTSVSPTSVMAFSVVGVSELANNALDVNGAADGSAPASPDTGAIGPTSVIPEYVQAAVALHDTALVFTWSGGFTSGGQDVAFTSGGVQYVLSEAYLFLTSLTTFDAALVGAPASFWIIEGTSFS